MTNPNDLAYPIVHQSPEREFETQFHNGLTKREYFAAMAMQGLLANSEHRKEYKGQTYLMEYNIYADQSAKLADALIEALNKTEK